MFTTAVGAALRVTHRLPVGVLMSVLLAWSPVAHAQGNEPPVGTMLSDRAWLDAYCTFCHGKEKIPQPTAALVLDADVVDVDDVSKAPALWEKVVRRVRAATHPPSNLDGTGYPSRGPGGTRVSSRPMLDAFVRSMERKLDGSEAKYWTAGRASRAPEQEIVARLTRLIGGEDPDAQLLRAAKEGRLRTPGALGRQVRDLLKKEKSSTLVQGFFWPWLKLDRLASVAVDGTLYPTFDESLRQAMARETTLFLQAQLAQDRPVLELLTADYTFVNERLASHYGVAGVTGGQFKRVSLAGTARAGLLGQASVLTSASTPTRTSPVQRAVWILDTVLGTPPARKPFNAPLKDAPVSPTLRVRDRFIQHRRAPQCAVCHIGIDPIGFALENFDAIGRWRTVDAGSAVDATGTFFDGTSLNGPTELRRAILDRRRAFILSATERLMAYALARPLEYYDMAAIRRIVDSRTADKQTWSSIIAGVVESVPFVSAPREQHSRSSPAVVDRCVVSHCPTTQASMMPYCVMQPYGKDRVGEETEISRWATLAQAFAEIDWYTY